MNKATCFFFNFKTQNSQSLSSVALKSDRREPASQDLLSRLNVVARCSRKDSRKYTLACNPALRSITISLKSMEVIWDVKPCQQVNNYRCCVES